MTLIKFSKKTDIDYVLSIQRNGYGTSVNSLRDYCYKYFISVFLQKYGLSKYDAEDYFQEAFVTLWTQITTKNIVEHKGKLYRWKLNKNTNQLALHSFDRDIRSYLVDIGSNYYHSDMRKKHEYGMDSVKIQTEPHDLYEGYAKDELEKMVVADSLNAMPRGCRSLLRMFIYEQLSNQEVLERTRGRYSDADSLKTGKNKCMKKLRDTSKALLAKIHY